jgi:hypothetical protein
MLDLYARTFEGKRLRPDEYVISTDEKSELQSLGAGIRPCRPGRDGQAWSSSSTGVAARSRTQRRGIIRPLG